MWPFNKKGPSGFSSSSTAEQVTEGIDGNGLIAIVTGASSGIGMETARVLALRGVHVIMGVRNLSAGNNVMKEILEEIPTAKVDVLELDLSSMSSVKKFASDFGSLNLPLNILINNEGVLAPYKLSHDGVELQFATNHLAMPAILHMDNQSLQIFCMQMSFLGILSSYECCCLYSWKAGNENRSAGCCNNMLCGVASSS